MKVIIFFLLLGQMARADIIKLTGATVTDLQLAEVANGKCPVPTDRPYKISIKTATVLYTREYCASDIPWNNLYDSVKQLIAPDSSASCLIAESCVGLQCQRQYGMTIITDASVTLFTNGSSLQDYKVSAQLRCQ